MMTTGIYDSRPPVGRPKDKPESAWTVDTPLLTWGRNRKGAFEIRAGSQPMASLDVEAARRLALAILESDPTFSEIGVVNHKEGRRSLVVRGPAQAIDDCFTLMPFEQPEVPPGEAAQAASAVARAYEGQGEG